ncbi:hypothetical protein ACFV0H_23315 [Streptomyces erythrochromogenes]|uniref:Uncharacterized protein n=1 Tax=Streptomyces erythrochromogenes TaxID=285574 RepID=A0ABZ1Q8M4_9ACTN|nr:hypothetical protein [Streptomyces erythrochromogenes]
MTHSEVEIYWPAALPSTPALEQRDVLRDAGVSATCLLRPTRRGAADAVLVLVTSAVLEPFLSALFGRLAEEAHKALKAFVDGLLSGGDGAQAPGGVVVESGAGGRVTFTADLPDQAYEQAVGLEACGDRWVWDSRRAMWTPA